MNKPDKAARVPIKMPEALLDAALDIIKENPRIGMRGLLKALIKVDPRWAIHFYKHAVESTLTYADQVRIAKCTSKYEAKKLYEGLLKPRVNEYSLEYKMATRIKNALRKRGHKIFGGLRLGYIHESSLDAETAALWLHPRIRKLEKEADLWEDASRKLNEKAKTVKQRAVAKQIERFVVDSIDRSFLKGVADELELHFIEG